MVTSNIFFEVFFRRMAEQFGGLVVLKHQVLADLNRLLNSLEFCL